MEPPRLGLPGLHAWDVLLGQTQGWGDRKASERPDHGPGSQSPHQHRTPNLPPDPLHHRTVLLLVSALGFFRTEGRLQSGE